MRPLIHVTTAGEWERACRVGAYGAERVDREGFLHMCRLEQLEGVLHRYFEGTEGLVGLLMDAGSLGDALRWESTPPSTERFPHLYRLLRPEEVHDVRGITDLLAEARAVRRPIRR